MTGGVLKDNQTTSVLKPEQLSQSGCEVADVKVYLDLLVLVLLQHPGLSRTWMDREAGSFSTRFSVCVGAACSTCSVT